MKPPALQPGDTIGVMAPSSYVEEGDIKNSKTMLEEKGYQVFVHPQTYEQHNQSAGTHLQKTLALQGLWQRDDIKAIWTAGGGNRALHLLEHINFDRLKENPKAFIGFSDVTALLNTIHAHTGVITFHGPVFKDLHKHEEAQVSQALELLSGETPDYPMQNAQVARNGVAEGPLIGGCLSIFKFLVGTKDCPDLEGSILFLEDTDDHLSRFDRMFLHLKRHGVFEKISGLIIGEFLNMQEGSRRFGFSLEELIAEHTEDLDIPIVANAPFGHGEHLYTFPIGVKAKLDTSSLKLQLLEAAVEQ